MKKSSILLFVLVSSIAFSQEKIVKDLKEQVRKIDAEAHLTFLASDEMRGRGTGTHEIAIAANYIATQFKLAGLKMPYPMTTYFQEVGLRQSQLPQQLEVRMGKDVFKLQEEAVLLKGSSGVLDGEFVFVGYGQKEDFDKVDVKGKVVVSHAGSSEKSTLGLAYRTEARAKNSLARGRGATALIELVNFPDTPWEKITGFFLEPRISLEDTTAAHTDLLHVWIKNSPRESIVALTGKKVVSGSITLRVPSPRFVAGRNVIGWIEGTDPALKKEFIALSAHYDHLGVKKNSGQDSIYNGARDNAIGVTAILEAAHFLSKNPPKRSVVIIAFCAEEKGLLGSQWYSMHPAIPTHETAFNLNCDGAGYNDKTTANLVGLGRTTADDWLGKACVQFGLTLTGDPAPHMNLYERSDNYNFASLGVPAVNFSPGIKTLEGDIMKTYHQPADESASLDFSYLEQFFQAYVMAAYLVGNSPDRLFWMPGDKFEAIGKKLYGIK